MPIRCSRRWIGSAALLALLALPVGLSLGRAPIAPERPSSASLRSEQGQSDVIALTEARPGSGLATLLGVLAATIGVAAGASWFVGSRTSGDLVLDEGRLRRWRARLEGAPPCVV